MPHRGLPSWEANSGKGEFRSPQSACILPPVTTKTIRSAACILGLVASSIACGALAQTLPGSVDPGRVERRFEPSPTPRATAEPTVPETGQQGEAPAGAENISFVLADLAIEGATVLDEQALRPLYAGDLGKTVTLARIYAIAAAITARYRGEGYVLSRALVPAQRIREGTARIRVVEGFIDRVSVEGETDKNRDLIDRYVAHLTQHRPLHVETLERYLLLLNDLPGIRVRSVLRPSGDTPGAADLVLSVTHTPVTASATVDNRGSEFLGQEELSLSLQGNSLLDRGDSSRLSFVGAGDVAGGSSNELRYYDLSHQQALGDDGLTAGLRLTHSRTHPGGSLAIQDIDGRSSSAALSLAYPWIRSRQQNLELRLSLSARNSRTTLLSQLLSEDKLRVARLAASYDVLDRWNGISLVNAEFSQGFAILGASDSDDANLSRAGGRPEFSKLNLDASRLQRLADRLNLLLVVSSQISAAKLLSAEEFSVGGNRFGRGYDGSEITGDHGVAGKLELQWSQPTAPILLQNYQIYGFYDVGATWEEGSAANDSLASTGVGLRFNATDWMSGYVELAYPLTRPVASRAPGKRDDPRLFFSLSARF